MLEGYEVEAPELERRLRTRQGRKVRRPRTRFFRCGVFQVDDDGNRQVVDGCGSELAITVDLARYRRHRKPIQVTEGSAPWWMLWRPLLPAVAPVRCHCGGVMREAQLPRLVIPEPGGSGEIFDVMELVRQDLVGS